MEVTGTEWNQLAELSNFALATDVHEASVTWETLQVEFSAGDGGFNLDVERKS